MQEERFNFLKELVEAPSPSGYEGPAQRLWWRQVAQFADDVRTDTHGNVIAAVNPGGALRVMLAGHCDEIGFVVTYVDDDGFLWFSPIGGFDATIVPGQRVHVHTAAGTLLGVVGRRPIHVIRPEDRSRGVDLKDLWIDIGVADGMEAREVVAIGDPVTIAQGLECLRGNLVVSRALDNKVGAFIVAETLRKVSAARPRAAVYGVSTVQEEIGLRGARTSTYSIDPHVGIAIDVTWATDHPGMKEDRKRAGEMVLGRGIVITRGANVNPIVFQRLVRAAREAGMPYQVRAVAGGTGNDGNAMQISRAGVAIGVVGVPLRYMHTPVEIISLADLETAIAVLAGFLLDLDESVDFTPS
jgi:endoglucanase